MPNILSEQKKHTPFLRKHIGLIFILPALILHLCVVMIPSVSTFVMSFYDWNGLKTPSFIGLDNFIEIFTEDKVVWVAFKNNLIWMLIFLIVPLIVGLLVATLVVRLKHGQMFYRTAVFLPYVLSAVIAAKLWESIVNPYYGIPVIFKSLGFDSLANILWLGDPDIALFTVAFVDNWHWWGFVMVLFVAALHQVDEDLYEAVRIEGATKIQEFWYVTLPGIKPTFIFIISMSIMWSFTTFDYIWAMTQGGPGQATEILSTWIYKNSFTMFRSGYASALCVVQSTLVLIAFIVMRILGKGAEE